MNIFQLDQIILHWVNKRFSNPIFDAFFPFWTDVQKTPVFYVTSLSLILYFIFKKNWKLLKALLLSGLATWLIAKINNLILKNFFARPRPENVILRVEAQYSFSFPSSHALNAFCFATLASLLYPKGKKIFFSLALLTAFSRVYCGVHYPLDVLGGIFFGMGFSYLFYKLITMKRIKFLKIFSVFFVLGIFSAHAWNDPTGGKPFFPWVWEDQLRPTISKSVDKKGLIILGAGATTSLAVHQYDGKIYGNNNSQTLSENRGTERLGKLGNGVFGVGIALGQFAFDQSNGLRHLRALILNSASHVSIAAIVRRNRPTNKTDYLPFPSSFPSGHTAAAFASAGALTYSYGWMAAIPAYALASAISLSRIQSARHWASDIVGGAFLGTFWARASFDVEEDQNKSSMWIPTPVEDGMVITWIHEF